MKATMSMLLYVHISIDVKLFKISLTHRNLTNVWAIKVTRKWNIQADRRDNNIYFI